MPDRLEQLQVGIEFPPPARTASLARSGWGPDHHQREAREEQERGRDRRQEGAVEEEVPPPQARRRPGTRSKVPLRLPGPVVVKGLGQDGEGGGGSPGGWRCRRREPSRRSPRVERVLRYWKFSNEGEARSDREADMAASTRKPIRASNADRARREPSSPSSVDGRHVAGEDEEGQPAVSTRPPFRADAPARPGAGAEGAKRIRARTRA